MKTSLAILCLPCIVCVALLTQRPGAFAQDETSNVPTRTIVGDLLMIDRDLYIVRSEYGEVQVEATPQTKIAEDFQFGDRIKARVLMNNQALTIDRAGPGDVPGVAEHQAATVKAPVTPEAEENKDDASAPAAPPKRPTGKTVVGDLLMIDRDLYIVRSEYGEVQVEATPQTKIAEDFQFGDRIKARVLMNNQALTIDRAGPDDVPGVMVHGALPPPRVGQDEAGATVSDSGRGDDTKVVEGRILMVDGDFYVIRGERGEIRIERTPETRMTGEFKFGDLIKATVTATDRALAIERLRAP